MEGTLNILNSALKHRATVRHVVMLSLAAAIFSPTRPEAAGTRVLDERDWNEFIFSQGGAAEGRGDVGIGHIPQEQDIREKRNLYEEAKAKGGLEWDLTLNPPFVYGPVSHEVPPLEGFGGTAGMRYTTTTLSWES